MISLWPLSSYTGFLSFLIFLIFLTRLFFWSWKKKTDHSKLPPVPVVPGLPLIGNLLQLKEKKPNKTFLKWAEIYGPIYSFKAGASTVIVINSNDLAKEAMVTRYSSISTRKLSNALKVITHDKCMVAVGDYDEFYKMSKRCLINGLLGPAAQKRKRIFRDTLVKNVFTKLHSQVNDRFNEPVEFRKVFQHELFGFAMRQALGKDFESVYVEGLATTISRDEIFSILVHDIAEAVTDVDWRDFFPYLKWIPNKKFENTIQQKHFRRLAVMNALIEDRKKQTDPKDEEIGYLGFLLSEAKTLTMEQIAMLIWETIIETSDTTMVTAEWALYELAKNQLLQDRLYSEIENVCGQEKITEEQLSKIPCLGGVFQETLRKYSPAPLIPLRYAHEDTQIGGYHIPAGSEIAINIYGCNMDKNRWENPEEWRPERFIGDQYDPSDMYRTMAFGSGKRVCAGSLQASLTVCTTIGRLVQEFQWELADGEEENVDTVGLTSQKLYPLKAIITPRRPLVSTSSQVF